MSRFDDSREVPRRRKLTLERLETRKLLTADLSEMYVFGDSLSDTGNAQILTGGQVPLPPYYEGRFSDGPVFVEEAAKRLGLPEPGASFLGGTNYAIAGAATAGPSLTGAPSISEQIGFFLADENTFDGDELIFVQGGGNDAFADIFTGGAIGNDPITAADNLAEHIATLADLGGEVFAVPTVMPISPTPLVQSEPMLISAFDDWVAAFNERLKVNVAEAESALGVTIVLVDQFSAGEEYLGDPQKFGFANIADPACPDCGVAGAEETVVKQPHKYYFWDMIHPTNRVHKLFGKHLASTVKRELRPASENALPPAGGDSVKERSDAPLEDGLVSIDGSAELISVEPDASAPRSSSKPQAAGISNRDGETENEHDPSESDAAILEISDEIQLLV